MDKTIKFVQNLYTDIQSPVSFSSAQKIHKHVRAIGKREITLKLIKRALSELDSYNFYKVNRKRFPVPRVRVQSQFQQVEVDLMDVRKSSEHNNGVTFVYIAVDVLSKLAFAYSLKTKKSGEIYTATEALLNKWPKIESISSDRGSEFKSSAFQQLLEKKKVRHFFVGGKGKGSIVESFIRYMRARIARLQAETSTQSFISKLDNIIVNYNNTCHSSTKFKPSEVNEYNQYTVFDNLYNDEKKIKKKNYNYHYKIGDAARISLHKSLFQRESDRKFTREIFMIDERFKKDGVPMYKLKDCSGEQLAGSFYNEELSKVENVENRQYKIERLLDEKMINNVAHVLVKFEGYDKKCSTWLRKDDVIRIYNIQN